MGRFHSACGNKTSCERDHSPVKRRAHNNVPVRQPQGWAAATPPAAKHQLQLEWWAVRRGRVATQEQTVATVPPHVDGPLPLACSQFQSDIRVWFVQCSQASAARGRGSLLFAMQQHSPVCGAAGCPGAMAEGAWLGTSHSHSIFNSLSQRSHPRCSNARPPNSLSETRSTEH